MTKLSQMQVWVLRRVNIVPAAPCKGSRINTLLSLRELGLVDFIWHGERGRLWFRTESGNTVIENGRYVKPEPTAEEKAQAWALATAWVSHGMTMDDMGSPKWSAVRDHVRKVVIPSMRRRAEIIRRRKR